jgi:hypothetical protein
MLLKAFTATRRRGGREVSQLETERETIILAMREGARGVLQT